MRSFLAALIANQPEQKKNNIEVNSQGETDVSTVTVTTISTLRMKRLQVFAVVFCAILELKKEDEITRVSVGTDSSSQRAKSLAIENAVEPDRITVPDQLR